MALNIPHEKCATCPSASTSDATVTTLPQETLELQTIQTEMPHQNEVDNLDEVPLIQLQPNDPYEPAVTYLPTGPLQTVQLDELKVDTEYTIFTLQPVTVPVDESPPSPPQAATVPLDDLQFAPGVKSKGRPSKRRGVPTQNTTAKKKRLL